MFSLYPLAAFLRELADRVERQEVILRKGEEQTTLQLPPVFMLEGKAEKETSKKGKVSYSLEVELELRPGEEKAAKLELG